MTAPDKVYYSLSTHPCLSGQSFGTAGDFQLPSFSSQECDQRACARYPVNSRITSAGAPACPCRCDEAASGFQLFALVDDAPWDLRAFVGYAPVLGAKIVAFRGTDSHSWCGTRPVEVPPAYPVAPCVQPPALLVTAEAINAASFMRF